MVVQIFVSQTQTEQPLLQQIDQRMLDPLRIPIIRKAGRELFDQTKPLLDLPQQNPTTVGAHPPAVKPGHDSPPADVLKSKRPSGTLCFHETASSVKCKCVFPTSFTSGEAVSCHRVGEKCGLVVSGPSMGWVSR